MSKKIGFIGCGNMGTAMMQGILDSFRQVPARRDDDFLSYTGYTG